MGAQIDATKVAMNFEKVLDKVGESKFFYEELHEVHNQMVPGNPNVVFSYYFNAFLNAVYSVQEFAEAEVRLRIQGKKHKKQVWEKCKKSWCDTLTREEQELWFSLLRIRGTEVHQGRTKTTTTVKAVPPRHVYSNSQTGQAYRAFYVMQIASSGFPGVDLTQLTKDLGVPPGTNVVSYVAEHYTEIGGKSRSIPEVSKEIVSLCDRFVKHLQTVPI